MLIGVLHLQQLALQLERHDGPTQADAAGGLRPSPAFPSRAPRAGGDARQHAVVGLEFQKRLLGALHFLCGLVELDREAGLLALERLMVELPL